MTNEMFSSDPPPHQPPKEDDLVNRLRLLRSRRVGVATYRRLLAEHGTAAAALDALPHVAQAAGVADYAICPMPVVQAELKAGKAAGARLLAEGMADYPTALADIADAPPMLWCLGQTALLQRPMIAMVGARNASSLGTRMAKKMAHDLTEAGFAIVSGLARGIDAAAHLGALDGGTIAVQAGGVDVIYPTENSNLAKEIAQKGLRLSEMPLGTQPQARHFPMRNRIISGLAQAVVVVEAAGKSGSLITARNALDQGRDVLAVPGHPMDGRAWGCNMLIRDGATLVRDAQDVIDAVGTQDKPKIATDKPAKPQVNLRDTAALHNEILARLSPTPIAEDQLLRDIKITPKQIAPVLLDLELDGKIARHAGGMLARTV